MTQQLQNADAIAAAIPDGSMVALPPEYSYCAFEATRALVRRGAKDLHLLGVPVSGYQADMLIGAGCVSRLQTSAVSLGENGLAPRFTAAIKAGSIEMKDATCPAIHAALQASEKGVPFMPLRGIIGSSILEKRDDWVVGENPFDENDPIVFLPALQPDVALFHAPKADRDGNVWIGVRRELVMMAHASKATYVTVEEIVDENLLEDVTTASGTLPGFYVNGVAKAEQGAWPLAIPDGYAADKENLARYAQSATSEDGFNAYLDEFVLNKAAAE